MISETITVFAQFDHPNSGRPEGPSELSRGQCAQFDPPNSAAFWRDAGNPSDPSVAPLGHNLLGRHIRGRCSRLSSRRPPGCFPIRVYSRDSRANTCRRLAVAGRGEQQFEPGSTNPSAPRRLQTAGTRSLWRLQPAALPEL